MTVDHIHSCTFGVTGTPWVLGGQGITHQYMLGVAADIRGWCVPIHGTLEW